MKRAICLLYWLTGWFDWCAAHDSAYVDTAADLRQALLDPFVGTIFTSGRIDIDSRSFTTGSIVLNRTVAVISVTRSAVWHFPVGSQQAIVVGHTASLILEDFAIEISSVGSLSTPSPWNSDQWLWPGVVLYADASITLRNMVLDYNAGCAAISSLLPAEAQGAGPGQFHMDDYITHVTVPHPFEPQAAATQRAVNSNIRCNSASPATMQPIGTVWATTAEELLAGLTNTSVTSILIKQDIHLGKLHDDYQIAVIDGRFVSIAAGQAGNITLDFGFNCAVASVTSSAGIGFANLTLTSLPAPTECASPFQQQMTDSALRPNWGYSPFPAVLFDPNGTSALDQIQLSHLFVDCSADSMSELQQRILLSVGQSNLIYDGNQTLSIRGKHPILVPLAAPSSTQIVAQMLVQLEDTSIVCVADPAPPPGNRSKTADSRSAWLPGLHNGTGYPAGGPTDAADTALRGASSIGNDVMAWWLVVLITLGSMAGVLTLISMLSVWHLHRRRRRRSAASESTTEILSQVILDRTGSAASGFSQHSSSLAAGAAVHDDSNKQSDLADIEIGELLGRGSYGKVYKGGAMQWWP